MAVKVLPPELAASPGFRERFEREAKTISGLNHPHICVPHDIARDEGLAYLIMEYPDTTAKWQVSTGGGVRPRWRRDGKEIFYRTEDGLLMAAEISLSGQRAIVGKIRPLFRASFESIFFFYDVTPDGQRFIVNTP